jgi:hypothetical protein
MNKEALLNESNVKECDTQFRLLAMSASNERICNDAQPCLDPDSIKRFCQVWGEVGQAILARRSCATV